MKRFYKEVTVEAADGGFGVRLDGRAIKTVGGRPQVVPTRALAEALAAEWAGQGEAINPAHFVYRDMTDYALDVVTGNPASVAAEILPYAETDTLCYRAEPDEAFAVRQRLMWEPLLANAETRLGVKFVRVSGIIHKPQPPETLARLQVELDRLNPFELAALRNTASLAASLVIGLAALMPEADLDALWDAANLEEDWQAELWGKDEEALERRERRAAAFAAAARFAGLAKA
ncbi:MAG: molecular chaperone [Novosphingobium sp. 28-62-57]|uniref:ATP12 family chaperone protein n=1 Tax=unclassified Novosphingobium TaxID=2644732 RepID=UPI000BCF884C|nr:MULTISPECIES: ATP12 family protein [unclassified Novosphingobium]OYW48276.1 MAG: molecular chaperone [Novosphingobium sp. 12-62-10]OYZ10238.1 MAG: molecular chaperone [Novosphingobium sp. 28-62-57]OZA38045.1 MAG: molecular chaperone [Novosphingobium sp. 17-62-9]HQS70643.1 ATP12 family protein [Novosphingobium sp.]